MRQTLGTAVFFGMLGVTFFGIFLTPAFYIVVRWIGGNKPFAHAHPKPETPPKAEHVDKPALVEAH
jgi:hypothetical protein